MSYLTNLKNEFSTTIRSRGQVYCDADRVLVGSMAPGKEAVFKVRGSQDYSVRLRFGSSNNLVRTCTCPYFESGNDCKHIWAAILKAETHDFFVESRESKAVIKHQKENSLVHLPHWKSKLEKLNQGSQKNQGKNIDGSSDSRSVHQTQRVGFFVIDQDLTILRGSWVLRFFSREKRRSGDLGILKPCHVAHDLISTYPDELDQRALWSILGMRAQPIYGSYAYYQPRKEHVFLQPRVLDTLLKELSDANKLLLFTKNAVKRPLVFDSKPLKIQLFLSEKDGDYELSAKLSNGLKTLAIESKSTDPNSVNDDTLFLAPYLLTESEMTPTDFGAEDDWFALFQRESYLHIPKSDVDSFLNYYFKAPKAPDLSYPESLQVKIQTDFSKVRLVLDSIESSSEIFGQVQFCYGDEFVDLGDVRSKFFSPTNRTIYQRNFAAESSAALAFHQISNPAEQTSPSTAPRPILESQLSELVDVALKLGWEVIAFKKTVSQSKTFRAVMSSGIDWFDLSVKFEFGNGLILGLPQLLQNLKSGQRFISLADGTTGLIRDEWIKKFKHMVNAGNLKGESLRLSKIQALFYGAELCADKSFRSDRKFKTFQRVIEDINNISEIQVDPKFKGKLRKYQKKGLSWVSLMSKHEIGSVLADDMGLGKTVQILAALSNQRNAKTLLLAPKSLVFNWIAEAKKFTPHLRFHDHTGGERMERIQDLHQADVIVTTYQTFRLDVEFFKEKEFDYFILDEAHYVKNSESQAYMACKLIQARRKIALTGTPVENSLKDLFSILSIVTPGLISDSLAEKYAGETDPEVIGALSRSLRPFILRRTKDEVLSDLPKKSEQVLYCELSAPERKRYNELKNFYWNNLSGKIEKKGFQRSKIEILEALLRLRQASCHPGLLNPNLSAGSSAKFDLLLDQLETIIADGHKTLIFSQFTSLLGLLKKTLDARKIKYEYLDGKTKDRAARVKSFQEDDKIQVFLISLKAGGVGLNLTAADYVFILDPWWNPAAESQAIDRTHRIGQTKKVFAYKLIAKDTVEEKILALQEKKKALARAIISSEKSLIRGLKMEDLQELFS